MAEAGRSKAPARLRGASNRCDARGCCSPIQPASPRHPPPHQPASPAAVAHLWHRHHAVVDAVGAAARRRAADAQLHRLQHRRLVNVLHNLPHRGLEPLAGGARVPLRKVVGGQVGCGAGHGAGLHGLPAHGERRRRARGARQRQARVPPRVCGACGARYGSWPSNGHAATWCGEAGGAVGKLAPTAVARHLAASAAACRRRPAGSQPASPATRPRPWCICDFRGRAGPGAGASQQPHLDCVCSGARFRLRSCRCCGGSQPACCWSLACRWTLMEWTGSREREAQAADMVAMRAGTEGRGKTRAALPRRGTQNGGGASIGGFCRRRRVCGTRQGATRHTAARLLLQAAPAHLQGPDGKRSLGLGGWRSP